MDDYGSYSYVYVVMPEDSNIPIVVVQTEKEAIELCQKEPMKYWDYCKTPFKHRN